MEAAYERTDGVAVSDVVPRDAALCLNGWAGYHEQPVQVIGETPTRYRITAKGRTKLAGRMRWLNPGATTLVPKRSIIFKQVAA